MATGKAPKDIPRKNIWVDRRNKDAPKPKESSELFITVFTDASWCPETKAFGCAMWIKAADLQKPHKYSFGGLDMQDNIVAETLALNTAIKWMEENLDFEGRIIILQADCLEALSQADTRVLVSGIEGRHGAHYIKLKHVKGHAKGEASKTNRSKINSLVDSMAKKEMRAWRKIANKQGVSHDSQV